MSDDQNDQDDQIPSMEDSMSPPDLQVPEEIPIVVTDGDSAAERALAQLVNMNEGHIYHEPTCPICSCAVRKEAEQTWIDTKRTADVKAVLKDKAGINVTKSTIENHMLFHLTGGVRGHRQVEYLDQLKRLNSVNITTLDRIRLCLSALTERLMGVNSITPGGELSHADIEKIKSAETAKLMASFNQLLKLQAQILGEMKSSGELISIPRQPFVEIFNKAIKNAPTDEQRQALHGILDELTTLAKFSQ